jgi:predicted unusual protein kinase regulating ubiquinone biosynthesis (AarF/ABC1/UbiB family)
VADLCRFLSNWLFWCPLLRNINTAPAVTKMFLELKGLYIKFGQVLSVRPEMVPKAYRDQFKLLQSEVPGRPLEEVKAVIEAELGPLQPAPYFTHTRTCTQQCNQTPKQSSAPEKG